jgi:hypothetical protein
MFIDRMRDGSALRQEGHVGFYMHTLLDYMALLTEGEKRRAQSINISLLTEDRIQDSRPQGTQPQKVP